MNLAEVLQVAVYTALEAGGIIRTAFPRTVLPHVRYKGAVNPVTDTDTATESFIINRLLTAFPDHRILAEEGGFVNGNQTPAGATDAPMWVVDPLDGSTNDRLTVASSPSFAPGSRIALYPLNTRLPFTRNGTYTLLAYSGADPAVAARFLVAFALLQSMHYVVWIGFFPLFGREESREFDAAVPALRAWRLPALAVAAGAALYVAFLASYSAGRTIYSVLAAYHVYVEFPLLVLLAAGATRGARRVVT